MILERKCSKDLANFFRRLEKDIHKIIEDYWDSELGLFHLNKISDLITLRKQEYYDILFKYCKIQYNRSRSRTKRLFNLQLKQMSIKSDISITTLSSLFKPDPAIKYNLNNKIFVASEHTLNRVDKLVMNNLSESYKEGLGIEEAKNRLTVKYNGLKGWEAQRIARTEINSAQNDACFDMYGELGCEYQQWWTAQDERVRNGSKGSADHVSLHGKIVKVGTRFSNGLLYPGDRQGRIKEWINCRCTSIPYIIPLGKMAPMGMSEFTEDDLIDIPNWNTPTLEQALSGNYSTGIQEFKINLNNSNPHILSNLNPLERGKNAEVTYLDEHKLDFDWEKEEFIESFVEARDSFKTLKYKDGTEIEFELSEFYNELLDEKVLQPRLKSIKIDGREYNYLGDKSYNAFKYQREAFKNEYGEESLDELDLYINRFASWKGMNLNKSLREGYEIDNGDLRVGHEKFVNLIKSSEIKDDVVSLRVQTKLHESDSVDKIIVSDKAHTSTSTGAYLNRLASQFVHQEEKEAGVYWQIVTVVPKESESNALFLGNSLNNFRGRDWEYELNFAPNQKFKRLLIDEKNKVIIQTPINGEI